MKCNSVIPQEVQALAVPQNAKMRCLGKYQDKQVLGYKETKDKGECCGLPHVILYDNKKAWREFDLDDELYSLLK